MIISITVVLFSIIIPAAIVFIILYLSTIKPAKPTKPTEITKSFKVGKVTVTITDFDGVEHI